MTASHPPSVYRLNPPRILALVFRARAFGKRERWSRQSGSPKLASSDEHPRDGRGEL